MSAPDDRFVADYLDRSVAAMTVLRDDPAVRATLAAMSDDIVAALRAGGKLMIAGNGGSAADAQHIAGEFVARFLFDRAPLPAIALTTDSSAMTATANDYGYEFVFERQVRALGRPGDVVLGISTSGRSLNVLRALESARAGGMVTHGFLGALGGPMTALCDRVFCAPSTETPIIQQVHITAAHVLCATVERAMFPRPG
jgi:D-sedoheptulose 7-phosphate isomerase